MGGLWSPAKAMAVLLTAALVSGEPHTPIHEPGRCSIRGTCGKDSFFGPELPCPDNGLATDPEKEVRDKLVELCGHKWDTGPVCCEEKQVRNLWIPNCSGWFSCLDGIHESWIDEG